MIYLYAPPQMLQKSPAEMDLEEFFQAVALAQYAQKQRVLEVAMGISEVFQDE